MVSLGIPYEYTSRYSLVLPCMYVGVFYFFLVKLRQTS